MFTLQFTNLFSLSMRISEILDLTVHFTLYINEYCQNYLGWFAILDANSLMSPI